MPNNILMRQHQMHNMFATSNGYAERHMQRQMQDKNKRVMFLRKQRQFQLTREEQNRVKYTQNSIQMNLGRRDEPKPNTKKEIHHLNIDNLLKKYGLFWQYPVITEKTFYNQNKGKERYLGFPWATIIDKQRSKIPEITHKLIKEINIENNNYTCCQHIHFKKCIPMWKKLNIKTVYASHKKLGEDNIDGIQILPCPLYALNIENNVFNKDFQDIDVVKSKRNVLYSFVGGYVPKIYLSNIRERIFNMKHPKDAIVKNTGKWHLQNIVYSDKQNSKGELNKPSDYNSKTKSYNEILLKSRYSLCPSGSGPNSIRFWEALGAGSIPVLLADTLELPKHDLWEKTIVRIPEKDVSKLNEILEGIKPEEEKHRREGCVKLYKIFRDNYINE